MTHAVTPPCRLCTLSCRELSLRPYTRLVPKVSNLTAQGTLRLGLTRLVPQLPGFGALLISFARMPQVCDTLCVTVCDTYVFSSKLLLSLQNVG